MTQSEKDIALTLSILQAIRAHGIENPIKSSTIQERFGIGNKTLCKIVRLLRRQGEPIGANDNGYYMAASWSELEPSIIQIEERAKDLLATASIMRRRFTPNQLTLNPYGETAEAGA